mmetsp:Transcript_57151/g.93994  ORF Transcript_57151/g.93994 Transcript_57151/m.93994 type:complete len:221 (-) Transcript_57151:502-1164(-)
MQIQSLSATPPGQRLPCGFSSPALGCGAACWFRLVTLTSGNHRRQRPATTIDHGIGQKFGAAAIGWYNFTRTTIRSFHWRQRHALWPRDWGWTAPRISELFRAVLIFSSRFRSCWRRLQRNWHRRNNWQLTSGKSCMDSMGPGGQALHCGVRGRGFGHLIGSKAAAISNGALLLTRGSSTTNSVGFLCAAGASRLLQSPVPRYPPISHYCHLPPPVLRRF